MEPGSLLRDLAVVLAVAGATAALFARWRVPLVLGYLAAGVLIGPHLQPWAWVHDIENIQRLVEVGIAFLLFVVGLEFRLYRLREVGLRAVVVGLGEIILMGALGFALGRALGWGSLAAAYVGAAFASSSTIMLAYALQSRKMLTRPEGKIAMNLSLIEDIVSVLILVILSGFSSGAHADVASLGRVVLLAGLFIGTSLLVGLVLIPRLLNHLFRSHHHEATTIVALGIGFGLAVFGNTMGFSIILGAFLGGTLVAESVAREWLLRRLETMRAFFVALFFVSLGILFDPRALAEHWAWAALALGVYIVGKTASVWLAGTLAGMGWRESVTAGLSMAVLGEMSFVVAAQAVATGSASEEMVTLMVTLCAATAACSPLLLGRAHKMASLMERWMPGVFRSFLSVYETRIVGDERSSGRRGAGWLLRKPFAMLAGEILLLSAWVGSCNWLARFLDARWPDRAAQHPWIDAALWAMMLLVALPFGVALWRNVQVISGILAEMSRPRALSGEPIRGFESAMQGALSLVMGLILIVWFGVLIRALLPSWPVGLALGCLAVLCAVLLWRRLIMVHQRVERAIQTALADATNLSLLARKEAREILEEEYPVDGLIREVTILPGTASAGRTLRQLRIREETGASVLAVRRSGFEVVNPSPDTPLFPEDQLLLVGGADHLKAAAAWLRRSGSSSQALAAKVRAVPIEENSPGAGHSLRELNVRQATGAMVVMLQRQANNDVSPSPDTVLQPGDTVLLFGDENQFQRAADLLAGSGSRVGEKESRATPPSF
jgi:CPA2 family monovalent cation:H+ antiporter-2